VKIKTAVCKPPLLGGAKPLVYSVGDCKSPLLEAEKKYARPTFAVRFFLSAIFYARSRRGAEDFPSPSNIKRRSNYL
jgi:hypothetical protein